MNMLHLQKKKIAKHNVGTRIRGKRLNNKYLNENGKEIVFYTYSREDYRRGF